MSKGLGSWYDHVNDRWLVDSPTPLNAPEMERIRQFIYKVNLDRYRGLSPGDRKDYVKKGLLALRANRIERFVKTGSGDVDLFKATQGTGKVISLPGVSHG